MPLSKKENNPYRLVALPSDGRKKEDLEKKQMHERFQGISGMIQAEILTLTPLIIGGRKNPEQAQEYKEDNEKSFMHNPENKLPLIPGASLKGVIWTLYEMLTGSEKACKAIFGDMHRSDPKGNFKGNVYFSDAVIDVQSSVQNITVDKLSLITTVLGSPKKTHTAFYQDERSQRKLYHHQPKVNSTSSLRKEGADKVQTPLYPLPANCRFTFSVHFKNLNAAQLASFMRCLFLPQGLCHKIGGGKSVGAGSVHIQPLSIKICPDKQQLYRGKQKPQEFQDAQACLEEIERRTQGINFTEEIQKMLLWRSDDKNQYDYPDYGWFKKNSQVGLKSINDVYPQNLQEEIPLAQKQIQKRWQDNQSMVQAARKIQEEKQAQAQKQAAFAALSPLEQAMQQWKTKEDSAKLEYLYSPEKLKISNLDPKEFQKAVLAYYQSEQPDKCKDWKKSHKKGKGPWEKICKIAQETGIAGFVKE
ncbi:MAG: hypothetical protein HUU50_08625 [Candidatus Brocadiae bacterium]|nr:hypothetical protein [Candidatus Brocadiia bacterium]